MNEFAHPPRRLPQIVSIQYLRALAALAVVLFHGLEATSAKFGVGAAGVDIFFVISGFIMWTLTERGEARPSTFLWRRLIRIAPPYWIATLLVVAVVAVRPNFLWMPRFSSADVVRSLVFAPYKDAWGRTDPVLTQGWTLNYEMFFYAAFALVLLAPRRWQLAMLTTVLSTLVVLGYLIHPTAPALATYTSLSLLEFLAGVGLGALWLDGRLRGASAGGVLVVVAVAAFAIEQAFGVREGPYRAIYWGAPALALVAGALMLESAGAVPVWKLAKRLGDASYSIYLFHVFVIAAGYRLLEGAPIALRVGATMIASAAGGYLAFVAMERPITSALRGLPAAFRRARPARPAPGLAVAAVSAEPSP